MMSPLCSGLEGILRFHPELINEPKDDGYAPLHVAAVNNFADLVSLIASHVSYMYMYIPVIYPWCCIMQGL